MGVLADLCIRLTAQVLNFYNGCAMPCIDDVLFGKTHYIGGYVVGAAKGHIGDDTWHVTHSVWQSCVLPLLNSPYISVMDPVSMPPTQALFCSFCMLQS